MSTLTPVSDDEEDVVVFQRDDPLCTLTINRPEANNAINNAVRDRMVRLLDEIETDPALQVVIITGAGDEAFSVGSDASQLVSLTNIEARAMAQKSAALHERLVTLSKPVIAAVKGACVGAGLELALHCDLRFARTEARFGLPGVNAGLVPSGGTISRLSQIIGGGPARALAFTGGLIPADRAFALGLVTNVLNEEEFSDWVVNLAGHIAAMSPDALRELKMMFRLVSEGRWDELKDAGIEAMVRVFQEGDASERLNEMFGTAVPPPSRLH